MAETALPVFKFKLNGQEYQQSSDLPTMYGSEEKRGDFQKRIVGAMVEEMKKRPAHEGDPVYVATGGGYGSFDLLIAQEKEAGTLDKNLPSIKGDLFRDLAEFTRAKDSKATEEEAAKFTRYAPEPGSEAAELRRQIEEHLKAHGAPITKDAIDQIQSSFYNNEVNTLIGKEVVKAASAAGQSSAYESASLYKDTMERAEQAAQAEVKVTPVLIVGMRDIDKVVVKDAEGNNIVADKNIAHIEPRNIATSHKNFAKRFDGEQVGDEQLPSWKDTFKEIRIYDTNNLEKPVLLMVKTKGGTLEPVGRDDEEKAMNKAKFEALLAKDKALDPEQYASKAASANNDVSEHKEREKKSPVPQGMGGGMDMVPPVQPGLPKNPSAPIRGF